MPENDLNNESIEHEVFVSVNDGKFSAKPLNTSDLAGCWATLIHSIGASEQDTGGILTHYKFADIKSNIIKLAELKREIPFQPISQRGVLLIEELSRGNDDPIEAFKREIENIYPGIQVDVKIYDQFLMDEVRLDPKTGTWETSQHGENKF